MNKKKFLHLDGEGQPWAVVSTEQMSAKQFAIFYNKPTNRPPPEVWKALFAEAKQAALSFGSEKIESRLRKDYDYKVMQEIFCDMGFQASAGRIEYGSEVEKLITEGGSLLTWRSAADLKWSNLEIAEYTAKITEGALDISADEKPIDFIQDWLIHEELTCGKECIEIGFLKGRACALIVAQINIRTGWSRLSYLGIIPECRGQGLGKWVHRHGFEMIKAQGGKYYHGGTHVKNEPMRKLFEDHGCKLLWEMEEWSYELKAKC